MPFFSEYTMPASLRTLRSCDAREWEHPATWAICCTVRRPTVRALIMRMRFSSARDFTAARRSPPTSATPLRSAMLSQPSIGLDRGPSHGLEGSSGFLAQTMKRDGSSTNPCSVRTEYGFSSRDCTWTSVIPAPRSSDTSHAGRRRLLHGRPLARSRMMLKSTPSVLVFAWSPSFIPRPLRSM